MKVILNIAGIAIQFLTAMDCKKNCDTIGRVHTDREEKVSRLMQDYKIARSYNWILVAPQARFIL